jgi:hypothetical protein
MLEISAILEGQIFCRYGVYICNAALQSQRNAVDLKALVMSKFIILS